MSALLQKKKKEEVKNVQTHSQAIISGHWKPRSVRLFAETLLILNVRLVDAAHRWANGPSGDER